MFRRLALLLLLPWCASQVDAAGHFDVDDAATLDPGQCQYELWGGRFGAVKATEYHLGPSCRVGPVELGLNLDRASVPGEYAVGFGPQLKWTFMGEAPESRLQAALYLAATWDVTRGGRTGGQFTVPVSWHALDPLWLNLNLGYDWSPGNGERTGRGGLQGNWAFNDTVSLVVERFKAFDNWTSRAGLRFNLTPTISLDLSAARSGPDGVRGYAIGLNQVFER
ncbi:TonB-dependent receptor [Variovorax sp. J22P168]|uniref:TonB-dependent receptor n=1 Tax=Variovorax jilinensis TaxID=3053513 RepID=UPI0025777157|nr:TonB-dependent receptor [Variovorax sp. J22P168]MDM0012509.1 TonB-dependent receptor [Variovorax sp. J22P168]